MMALHEPVPPLEEAVPRGANLFRIAEQALLDRDPEHKITVSQEAVIAWMQRRLVRDEAPPPETVQAPGRPERPLLVAPGEVPRRSLQTETGRAAFIHALTHIEFNAINLAWDAVYRYRDLPDEFYEDWVRVAAEEAYHFTLLRDHLREMGYDYGHFTAHDGLWQLAVETADDPLARMALVARVAEARGLDVIPEMIRRLTQVGEDKVVDLMNVIHRDEIGHVSFGSKWFRYLCDQRGLEPRPTFRALVAERGRQQIKLPLNEDSRRRAGFTDEELDDLKALAADSG